MGLREKLIEAGARDMFDVASLDELHPEDQATGILCASQMLDSFLGVLTDNADEWSGEAVRRHPFGKGPVSTPKTVIEHAIAALRDSETGPQ